MALTYEERKAIEYINRCIREGLKRYVGGSITDEAVQEAIDRVTKMAESVGAKVGDFKREGDYLTFRYTPARVIDVTLNLNLNDSE